MNFLGQKFGGGKPSGVGLGGFTELLCSSLIYTQTRRMDAHAHTDMCLSTCACTLTYTHAFSTTKVQQKHALANFCNIFPISSGRGCH